MSFFGDLFSGDAEKRAADANRQLISQYGQTGNAALDTGLAQSTGAVNTGANAAGGYLGQNRDIYGNLLTSGSNTLNTGLQNSLGALGQAGQAYAPLSALASKYGAGTDMYMNSLGLNGAAGNAAATDAFHAAPGYDWQLTQGLNAIDRSRANSGMLNSGNTDLDALKYGQGLANQAYTGWQSNLAGLISPELSATQGAATGQAGVDTNIANLYNTNAANQLGLQTGVAQGQAGANTALAQNQLALGNSLAGLYSGDASNRVALQGGMTSGNMAANNTQAAGEAAGAKNLLGLGQSLLTFGASGGLGGLGSGLSSLFGGGTGGTAGTMQVGSQYFPKFS